MENKRKKVKLSLFLEFIILLFILGFTSIVMSNNDLDEDISSYSKVVDSDTEINIKIKELKNKYNINIIYGNDTIELARNVKANIITNNEDIIKQLDILKVALEKYAKNFFIKDSLTIVLLESFNNNNLALASKNSLGEYKIYLSNNKEFERSIHHEIYHVFEYMNNITNSKEYANWDNLNPVEFSYSDKLNLITNEYVFGSTTNDLDVYFVSRYSKTIHKEDRAEIFAEIMMDKYNFKNNLNLIKKIETIENVIKSTNNKILIDINKYD